LNTRVFNFEVSDISLKLHPVETLAKAYKKTTIWALIDSST